MYVCTWSHAHIELDTTTSLSHCTVLLKMWWSISGWWCVQWTWHRVLPLATCWWWLPTPPKWSVVVPAHTLCTTCETWPWTRTTHTVSILWHSGRKHMTLRLPWPISWHANLEVVQRHPRVGWKAIQISNKELDTAIPMAEQDHTEHEIQYVSYRQGRS